MWLLRNENRDLLGPVSTELLLRGIEAGRVPADTQACLDGSDDWQLIGGIAAFARAFSDFAGAEAALDSSPEVEPVPGMHTVALEELCIPQNELAAGYAVSSRVRLTRLLGSGATASVWLARDERLDREVAVKVMAPDLSAEHPDIAKRFEIEAKAAAKIRSPHVVELYDCGTLANGVPYVVLELLDGETLAARLARCRVSPTATAGIVTQIARGLSAAHRCGVVHRDIKPSNVFLSTVEDEQLVKVIDFGLAKHASEDGQLTRTGWLVGMPHYMSPEQIMSAKEAEPSADLWALAVLTYEMITGQRPFAGASVPTIMMAVTNFQWQRPSELGTDPQFDAWFERAFHPEADQRFASAKSMAAALVAATESVHSASAAADCDRAQVDDERDEGSESASIPEPSLEAEQDDGTVVLPMVGPPRLPKAMWWIAGALAVGIIVWLVMRSPSTPPSDPVSIPSSSQPSDDATASPAIVPAHWGATAPSPATASASPEAAARDRSAAGDRLGTEPRAEPTSAAGSGSLDDSDKPAEEVYDSDKPAEEVYDSDKPAEEIYGRPGPAPAPADLYEPSPPEKSDDVYE